MKQFLCCILFLAVTCGMAHADQKLKIVATLSSFADIAATIGGDYVEVTAIGSPRFNPHFIEPRPSDVLRLKRADLYLHSGLDLEAWSGPLVDASARPEFRKNGARQLDLSQGITLLNVPVGQVSRAEGDIHLFGNPHYWLNPQHGVVMARTIATKLSELDPVHAENFEANYRQFATAVSEKMEEWRTLVQPFAGRKLIGYHDEWRYLMQFSGLVMDRFLESKPGIPPSPGQIASLIEYAKNEGVQAIVQPTFYSTEAAEELARHSGATVVRICQNVGELPEASSYIAMIDFNIKQIVGALSRE